jgi:putative ABC transport system permease protein
MMQKSLDIQKTMTWVGAMIVGVSLLVGGIGMMNVMLTSVAERTREIGLRRAIGARKKDILLQFLIESCVLSALGGLLGLLSGTALARFLAFVFRDKIELTPQIEPSFLVTSVGAGIVMGVLFGLYPAIKASRLSPADALRIS